MFIDNEYKLFFSGFGDEQEIRRVLVKSITGHNYSCLIHSIQETFPLLKDVNFTLDWKDREGDNVTIGSEEELEIALNEMKGNNEVQKLYVKVKNGKVDGIIHRDVICDVCDHTLHGFRYKCLVCPCFEICSDCERSQAHPDHPVLRIPKAITPDAPFGKIFANDLKKISSNIDQLFNLTEGNSNHVGHEKKSENIYDGKKKSGNVNKEEKKSGNVDEEEIPDFCHYKPHNIIAKLLVKKLMAAAANQQNSTLEHTSQSGTISNDPGSLSKIDRNAAEKEKQNIKILTNEFNSLSIDDVKKGENAADKFDRNQDHENNGGVIPVTVENCTVGNYLPPSQSRTCNLGTLPDSTSDFTCVESDPFQSIHDQIESVPSHSQAQIGFTPNILPPTPFFEAPQTPSSIGFTPFPVPENIANPINIQHILVPTPNLTSDSIPENNHSGFSHLSPDSIQEENIHYDSSCRAAVETSTPVNRISPYITSLFHKFIPQLPNGREKLAVPLPSAKMGPIEETMTRLQLLGFGNEDWLRPIVEEKNGNIKEVLKFLQPIRKTSANL